MKFPHKFQFACLHAEKLAKKARHLSSVGTTLAHTHTLQHTHTYMVAMQLLSPPTVLIKSKCKWVATLWGRTGVGGGLDRTLAMRLIAQNWRGIFMQMREASESGSSSSNCRWHLYFPGCSRGSNCGSCCSSDKHRLLLPVLLHLMNSCCRWSIFNLLGW